MSEIALTVSSPRPSDFTRATRRLRLLTGKLHWLSWLVLVGTLVPVVLLEIPGYGVTPTLLEAKPFQWGGSFAGSPPDPNEAEGPLGVIEYKHGWPWTYLRRATGSGGKGWRKDLGGKEILGGPTGGNIAPWDWTLAWWSPVDASRWSIGSLVGDVIAAIVLVVGSVIATQTWIRRRGNRIRLRIVDLLGVMVCVATAFGWRAWHLQLQARESHFRTTGPKVTSQSYGREPQFDYYGPEWMARLVGDWRVRCCRHMTSVQIDGAEATLSQLKQLSRLAALESVSVYGFLSKDCLAALSDLPRLRKLTVMWIQDPWDHSIANGQYEYEVGSVLCGDNLEWLTRLRRLETLSLHSRSLLIEDFAIIDEIPTIREVNLRGTMATLMEQYEFRRTHPHLTVICDDEAVRPGLGDRRATKWEVARASLRSL